MTVCGSIKAMRLDTAARLLSESLELGIKEVATAVGFQDRSHFSRAFKARFGRAPQLTAKPRAM